MLKVSQIFPKKERAKKAWWERIWEAGRIFYGLWP
jgi:hypothetical protein